MCQQFCLSVNDRTEYFDERLSIGKLFAKKDASKLKHTSSEVSENGSSIKDEAMNVVGKIADFAKMLFWK